MTAAQKNQGRLGSRARQRSPSRHCLHKAPAGLTPARLCVLSIAFVAHFSLGYWCWNIKVHCCWAPQTRQSKCQKILQSYTNRPPKTEALQA